MTRFSAIARPAVLACSLAAGLFAQIPGAQTPATEQQLVLLPGKSTVLDCASDIRRVAIANPAVAEVTAVSSREVLVNGLAPGETSLVIWLQTGPRLTWTLTVPGPLSPLDRLKEQLRRDPGYENVSVELENGAVFLRGSVKDQTAADRAVMVADAFGKPVNLLMVDVPPAPAQILLKVRFANVDRAASMQLGANILSTGATNTIGQITTGQQGAASIKSENGRPGLTLSDALNLFLFRPDLNLGATIRALQSKNLLEILAEPNVLATDHKAASFVAGGEFPFPTVQGGANAGAVTISFREFGIRIGFLPDLTPRGTIRLHVTPEVSSLDFANGLVFQGFTIPALSTRRVDTEVELESGQSFAIAGLLDNRTTESLSKIPGLGNIPLLGKLFQSVSTLRANTELIVIITPELVLPIPSGKPVPEIPLPKEFMKGTSLTAPRTPGEAVTGPVPQAPRREKVPVEELRPHTPEGSGPSPVVPGANPSAGNPPAGNSATARSGGGK